MGAVNKAHIDVEVGIDYSAAKEDSTMTYKEETVV